jgi:hypothetical protein
LRGERFRFLGTLMAFVGNHGSYVTRLPRKSPERVLVPSLL